MIVNKLVLTVSVVEDITCFGDLHNGACFVMAIKEGDRFVPPALPNHVYVKGQKGRAWLLPPSPPGANW
jgi:hypothetical protein